MSGVKQLIATLNGLTYLTNLQISHKRGTIVLPAVALASRLRLSLGMMFNAPGRLDQNWLENTNIEFVSLTFQSGAVTLSRRSNLPRLMPLLWSSNVADVLYHLQLFTIGSHRNQLINLGTHHLPVKASLNELHWDNFSGGFSDEIIKFGLLYKDKWRCHNKSTSLELEQ